MKPALVAVVVSVTAAFLASLALLHEARRSAELEKRLAVVEATLATERSMPAEVPLPDSPRPSTARLDPAAPPVPAKPDSSPELAKLQAAVDRLEARVLELSRAAHTSIDDEIAGLPADKLWDKSQMAIRDKLSERADALLRAFLQRFPNDPHVAEALLTLGKTELFNGDFAEAKQFYEQLLRDYPASPEAPYAEFYLGMSLIDAGDLTGGTAHYEKSVQALTGKPYWQAAALYNLGDAWKKKGQPEVAKDYFRKIGMQFGSTAEAKSIVDMAAGELKALEGQ